MYLYKNLAIPRNAALSKTSKAKLVAISFYYINLFFLIILFHKLTCFNNFLAVVCFLISANLQHTLYV